MLTTDLKVRETLADAVMQMAVHRKFYPEVPLDILETSRLSEGPWTTDKQQCNETVLQMGDYIHILGSDMWDDYDQSTSPLSTVGVVDNVKNIPMIDVFRAVKDARNMDQWRDGIISKSPSQATKITDYFNRIK